MTSALKTRILTAVSDAAYAARFLSSEEQPGRFDDIANDCEVDVREIVQTESDAQAQPGETVRVCDYWKPIPDGGIALPCSCGLACDGIGQFAPKLEEIIKHALEQVDNVGEVSESLAARIATEIRSEFGKVEDLSEKHELHSLRIRVQEWETWAAELTWLHPERANLAQSWDFRAAITDMMTGAAQQLAAAQRALKTAAVAFSSYSALHKAKGTAEGDAKAATNEALALEMISALADADAGEKSSERCEGHSDKQPCGPVVTSDSEGNPLCADCAWSLDREILEEIAKLVGFDRDTHDDLVSAVRDALARKQEEPTV